jgi:hypothetical protein
LVPKKGKKDLEIEIFCRGHQLEIGFLDTFFMIYLM